MQNGNFIPAGSQHKNKQPVKMPVKIGPPQLHRQQLKLNKKDDRIESIEVHCQCGEIIIIQCEYE